MRLQIFRRSAHYAALTPRDGSGWNLNDGYTTEAKSEARIDVEPEYIANLSIESLAGSMLATVIAKIDKERRDEFQEVCDEARKYRHAMSVAMEQLRDNKTDEAFATLQESEA